MLHGGSGGMSDFGLSSLGKVDCAARGEPKEGQIPPPQRDMGQMNNLGSTPTPFERKRKSLYSEHPVHRTLTVTLLSHSSLINQYA